MSPGNNHIKLAQKWSQKALVWVVLFFLGFLFGAIITHRKILPIDEIREFKNSLTKNISSLQANPSWPERVEQFEIFGREADVVMIGDSITQAGHWEDIFPGSSIANRGVGGDRTDDILRRIHSIQSTKPKKAFLMIGINDFTSGKNINETLNDYIKIVEYLKKQNIIVFIQSTIECRRLVCRDKLDKVRELNKKLEAYANNNKLVFINLNSDISTEQDGLLEKYTYDGIHLLGRGYVEWRKKIKPFIE